MTDQTLKDIDRAFKALGERDELLDEIKVEIEELDGKYVIGDYATYGEHSPKYVQLMEVLQIIDKYRNEVNHEGAELPDNMCTQRCCLKNHNLGIIECNEECHNRTLL